MNSKKIEALANETLQEITEGLATLAIIDESMEENMNLNPKQMNVLWSLRNAVRNIASSQQNLEEIIHLAETTV